MLLFYLITIIFNSKMTLDFTNENIFNRRYATRIVKTGFGLELKFLKIMMMLGLEKPEPKREREKNLEPRLLKKSRFIVVR